MADEKKKKEKKHWFKDMKTELKKVTWLTPKQLAKSTAAVITLVLIFAIIIFLLDRIFLFLTEQGIDKLKEAVKGNNTVVENTNTEGITTSEGIDIAPSEENNTETPTESTEGTETETEENNVVE